MKQPEIITKRLLLRHFIQSDANEVRTLAGNFKVSKTTLNIPHPYNLGVAEKWIKKHTEFWESKSQIIYAITNIKTGQLLGSVILVKIKNNQAEIGYWVGEPFWGLGYATEAAIGLIKFSFEKLGLNKIVAEHYSENPSSGKVMLKAGLSYVGPKKMVNRFGHLVDAEVYEIQNT